MPGGLDQVVTILEKARAWSTRAGQALRKSVFLRHWWRELVVVAALLLTIAAPFLLKPSEASAPSHYDRRLVIITPHHEKIRQEFGQAFARKWKERTGETLYVDWRVAGTGEITLMLRSDFAGAFEYYWTRILTKEWSQRVAGAFGNSKVDLSAPTTAENDIEQEARRAFLESTVGVGVDLFFGGGTFDFESQAKAGFLVSSDASRKQGLDALFSKHPEWFTPDALPQNVSGEAFYDKEHRWVGACLSSMGMVYNRDVLKRLGIEKEPAQWADLADPKYRGQIALADPNKSGTVTKAFDQLVQQQMQIAIDEIRQKPGELRKEKDMVNAGIRIGWTRGLQLIQRISANARYFTDNATKIPLEVSQGDAAAGMCIDFYGYSFEEMVRKADGTARVGFVIPVGGTGISVDPIGMLRGAEEPEAATAFMEFVMSDEGQRLWNYAPGTPGGPQRYALRRLPARKDFYTEANRSRMTDAQANPYEDAKAFTYHPERTGPLFNVLRFLVKTMCVENHDELRQAWGSIAGAHLPERSTEIFSDVSLVNYDAAMELAAMLAKKNKTQEMRKARELSMHFRSQYKRAEDLAGGGQ
ncbi:ABC-type Fe3+ transport system substrate-binding protein [Roseimicrobium gellanilyticum]|uniref:ABC-type Fe3+ transport system substrate-binding protein n=1 Tax=Roseimicrobium gellanilyticum TaxID=748857 RepID=A0A366HH46_9BACT|nr:extracellular solute-binding protein [Roseimicrobium gellanilyticum]RBP41256.1 ABC-type Fe3+ transport system substrate-binding protein [Roseimicrobium gellanilyticum]